jgi:hypothetical protein
MCATNRRVLDRRGGRLGARSLFALAVFGAWMPDAPAQTPSTGDGGAKGAAALAREHFERGYEAVRTGELELAISEFEKAYTRSPNFSVLYNLGQAYASSGRAVEAVDTLSLYLELGGAAISEERRKQVRALIQYHGRRIGELELTVLPPGATIALDGKALGVAPLSEPVRVVAGTHGVTALAEGHSPGFTSVRVTGRSRERVHLELVPLAGSGELRVACGVPDVTVEVDGKHRGLTPIDGPLAVTAGTRHVAFRRPGYLTRARTVNVTTERVERVDCGLDVDPAATTLGTLLVEHPAGTRVELDGAAYHGQRVPEGRHTLSVSGLGHERLTRMVRVRAISKDRLVMMPKRTSDSLAHARATRAGTQRRVAYVVGGVGLAAGSAALVLQLANEQRWTDWRADTRRFVGDYSANPAAASPRRLDALLDEENSLRNRDAIVLGVGVLAATLVATATALYFTAEGQETQLTLTPRLSRGADLGVRW